MGRTRRKVRKRKQDFRKLFKKPFSLLAEVMQVGFTDDDYVEAFKNCFPYLWKELQAYFVEYQKRDEMREKKGFKRVYNFPAPRKYIIQNARHIINLARKRKTYVEEEQRLEKYKALKEDGESKYIKQIEKQSTRLTLVQDVRPSYSNYFIKVYFDIKHKNPANVDERMIIILEAGKYRCRQTKEFLYKINSSERNFHLRHKAFLILQSWGEIVELHKNRKGKKRVGDTIVPNIPSTPKQLLEQIYMSQMEKDSSYDLFISHSSTDMDDILRLKTMINAEGLSIYLDWMNDMIGLRRDLTNADTARVLTERIKKSKAILYVHTSASLHSRWTPWEIGYADALGKKIAVYMPEAIEVPPYLEKYETAELVGDKFVVGDNKMNLKSWIRS